MAVTKKKQVKQSGAKKEAVKKETRKETAKTGTFQKMQSFFRGVANELKKVHWPTRNQTAIYTGVVLVSVFVVAVLIFIVDQILSLILKLVIPV